MTLLAHAKYVVEIPDSIQILITWSGEKHWPVQSEIIENMFYIFKKNYHFLSFYG